VSLYFYNKASNKNITVCKKTTKPSGNTTTASQIPIEKPPSTVTSTKGVINTVGNTNGNILNRGLAAQQGNWVYFNCKGLYKAMLDMKVGWQKICDDDAEDINVIGDYVYYTYLNTLYRISTNGKNKVALCEEKVRNVIVTSTEIYYINCYDSKIYKMNLNNNNKVPISADLCSIFSLEKDWIYYSGGGSEGDSGMSYQHSEIYKIKLDGSSKTKLITSESFRPIIHNGWLYYTNIDQQMKLFRGKSDGSTTEKVDDSSIRAFNFSGNYLVYSDFENIIKKVNLTNINENSTINLVKNDIFSCMYLLAIDNFILIYDQNKDVYKLNAKGVIEHISR